LAFHRLFRNLICREKLVLPLYRFIGHLIKLESYLKIRPYTLLINT
jgi:hypothetical protein